MRTESPQRTRSRSRRVAAALAVSIGLVAAACGGDDDASSVTPAPPDGDSATTTAAEPTAPDEDRRGGRLVIGIDAGPRSLDFRESRAIQEHTILDGPYESLLELDDALEPVPSLATEWNQVSDTVYEFTIREDVVFHDGSPMTADDVVFTFERIMDPEIVSPPRTKLYALESVTAVDDTTVRFELSAPQATFLFHLASPETSGIISQSYTESVGDDLNDTAVGTGAFKVTEYRAGEIVRMERHDEYWRDGLPYLDEIVFQVIPDDASRIAALRTGEIDMSWFRPDKLPLIRQIQDVTISSLDQRGGNQVLFMNCNQPPFDQLEARQAFAWSIDEQAIMDTIYEPGVPGPTRFAQPPLVGYGYTGDGSDLRYWGTDHDLARELMAEAGYPDGFEAEIVYINTPTFEVNQRMSELIAEQAARVGIDLTLKGIDVSLVELEAGEWSSWSTGIPMQADPDGATFWLRESNASVQCSTPELEELLDAQASEVDPERRREVYAEMMDYVEENAMMLFLLAEPLRVEVWADDVRDYMTVPHVRRTSLRQTWLDR